MTKVLVGLDGSDLAAEVVAKARALVTGEASFTLTTVVAPPAPPISIPAAGLSPVLVPGDTLTMETADTLTEETEARLAADAAHWGLPDAEVVSVVGEPGPVLCEMAREGDFDLVVVGSHGSGVIKRVLLGSVSHHVMHHAPCPVLVVRAPHD